MRVVHHVVHALAQKSLRLLIAKQSKRGRIAKRAVSVAIDSEDRLGRSFRSLNISSWYFCSSLWPR